VHIWNENLILEFNRTLGHEIRLGHYFTKLHTRQICKCFLVLSHDGLSLNHKIIIMRTCVFTASDYQEITNNYPKAQKTNEFHHKIKYCISVLAKYHSRLQTMWSKWKVNSPSNVESQRNRCYKRLDSGWERTPFAAKAKPVLGEPGQNE